MEDNLKDREIERLNRIVGALVERSSVSGTCKACGYEFLPDQDAGKPSFLYKFFQGILIGFALLFFLIVFAITIALIFF